MKTVVRRCLILVMCLSMCVSHISAAFVTGDEKMHNSVTEDTGGDEPIIYEEGADEETGISDEAVYGESAVFEDDVYGETQITGESETGESSVSDEGTYGETQVFEEETDKGSGMPEGSEAEQSVVSEEEAADESGFSGEEVAGEAEKPEDFTAGESDPIEAEKPDEVVTEESDSTEAEISEEVTAGESDPKEAEIPEEVTAGESDPTEAEMPGDTGISEEASGLVDEAEAGTGTQEDSADGKEIIPDEENSETEETQNVSSETRQYGDDVIVGFEELGEACTISLEYKISLPGLQEMLPEQLGIWLGGIVHYEEGEEGTLAPVYAEEYTIQSIDVTWSCVENYDESLEYFHFIPVIEGCSLAEGIVLPEITVHVEGEFEAPPLTESEKTVYDEFEVPIMGAVGVDGRPIRRGTFPAKYDAYAEKKLPVVRNQNPYGTCWAHGTIGAIEADLIADGKAGTDIDLSELHLAYFMSNEYYDEKNCNVGDTMFTTGSFLKGNDERAACNILTSMVGPALETDVPYSLADGYVPDPADGRSLGTAQLTGVYEINSMDLDAVKNAIMLHGGVDACYYDDDDCYSPTYNSYYNPETKNTNHTVMLVGWDDSFSRYSFNPGTPEKNGAWLVRNSWGFEGYDHTGYFWISYYDKSLNDKVLAMDVQTSRYDHCYAYDSIPFITAFTTTTGLLSGTQIFTVDGKERIQAVGIQTLEPALDVDISLECGKKSVSTSASTGYPGYYLIPLDTPLTIARRSEVTVTVTYMGDGDVTIPAERKTDYDFSGTVYHPNCGSGGLILKEGDELIETGQDGCFRLFTMDDLSVPRNISALEVSLSQDSYIYDGNEKNPAVTVKDGTVVLEEGVDYSVEYRDNINAGTAAVILTGLGDYEGTREETFTISKSDPVLLFAQAEIEKSLTDAAFINELSCTTDGTVTFSSSNTDAASVNSSTGEVTIKAAGTTTIIASAAEGINYNAGSASFTLTVKDNSSSVIQSGTCGDNLTWTLDDEGTLIISGTGDMTDFPFTASPTPWPVDQIKNVIIKQGVTSIGNYAFEDCTCMTNVEIPESITSIGDSAFEECDSLTGITIHEGVTSIGYGAFEYCDNLSSVTIPGSLTSTGHASFYGCKSLKNLVITEGVKVIEAYSFAGCNSLERVILPGSVTKIESGAFSECSNLTSVSIPGSVTIIEDITFENCSSLASVTIPEGVTEIGRHAFYGCSSLRNVTISEKLLRSYREFKGTPWLNGLADKDGLIIINGVLISYTGENKEITIPDDVSVIEKEAFDSSDLEKVTISGNVTTMGEYAFYSCDNLISLSICEGVTNIGYYAFGGCESLETVTIPESVETIEANAFDNCRGLKSVIISGNGCSIGSKAFYNCWSLQSVEILDGVASIGDNVFAYCSSLKSATISNSVTDFSTCVFYSCSSELVIYGYIGSEAQKYANRNNHTFVALQGGPLTNAVVTVADQTYSGKKLQPEPTVKLNGKTLTLNADYTVSYSNNINAGIASMTITGKGNYTGSVTKKFKINKAAQSITAKSAASSVAVGKTTTVSITGARGTKSFKSSDTTIATVTSAGKVTAKKVGTVKITAASAATSNYKAASKTVTIKVVPAATASLTAVNRATGIKLTWKKVAGANGYYIYRNNKKIATVNKGSTVTYTDKKANTNGTKYTYKIIAKSWTGTSKLSKSLVTYRVARPAVSSVKNKKSKKMKVKWKKNSKAFGYQILYSTNKNFKSDYKITTIHKVSTVSKTISGLKKGKTYYVKMRTYKRAGGKNYWSAWSAAKSVKIRK